jgi:hypothetical protein
MINEVKQNQAQKIQVLEKNIENLSMALRVNQLLLKQVVDKFQLMESELKNNTGILNDFQYRILGLQKYLPIDTEELSSVVDALKLKDWEEASSKDDVENNLKNVESVSSKEDIVILTSTIKDGKPDSGIFRSKIKLEEAGAELCEALLNKNVGDCVDVVLNNETHSVTLLGVRVKNLE